jgi:Flp pilus assembly protein TadD
MSDRGLNPSAMTLHGGSAMTSRTLGFVDHLLCRGRHFQQLGRTHDALRIFTRLAGLRELPAAVAEEAQYRLGELQLRHKKTARARRHLAAALRYAPDNPRYHFLLAQAFDDDRDGEPVRAADHYRDSLAQDSAQPDVLCAYGSLALRLNRTEEALECLRAAAKLAPDDAGILGKVAAGLRTAGHADEARSLLLSARFRHPRDRLYERLWNDYQFHAARRAQADARADGADDRDGPVLLPFVRPEPAPAPRPTVAGRIIRADGPTAGAPPHQGHGARRNAQ